MYMKDDCLCFSQNDGNDTHTCDHHATRRDAARSWSPGRLHTVVRSPRGNYRSKNGAWPAGHPFHVIVWRVRFTTF